MKTAAHLLLTGGTGFVGRALLRYWMMQDHIADPVTQVTVLTRQPKAFLQLYPEFAGINWLHFVQGDINDPTSLPIAQPFTHIIHAAADSTLGPTLSPLQRFDQIVQGTRHVLDLAVRCQAERFLLTSSGAVYGVQPSGLAEMPEDCFAMPDPLNATNAYGVAKRAAEHLCALYAQSYGLPTVIARCFAFVGPDLPLDAHFAIGNFIRDALWREAITVVGDGTPLRSYLDQQDLAHWLTTLLFRGNPGEAYNVGSDQAISIAELAHLVHDVLSPGKPVHILRQPSAAAGRNVYIPSICKAGHTLGLRVSIPIQLAISNTGAIHRQRLPL